MGALGADQDNKQLKVKLPKLQRGFVWEPARIIDLWDSLLRGFPIGSLLLSEIGDQGDARDGNDQYWLLDGQQRATTIAIGFYNPWESHMRVGNADEKQGWSHKVIPVLWIDLLPSRNENDEKLFFPYLATQSHPWGYNQSGGILSWGARRDAVNVFAAAVGHDNYTAFALKEVFPWEAVLPVPLAFVLECAAKYPCDDDQFRDALFSKCLHLSRDWSQRFGNLLAQFAPQGLAPFRIACASLPKYRVHLNYLTARSQELDRINHEDNSILFIRLNRGGKEIGGEELIFSLFKSAFPAAKDAVENAAAGFMPASQLFSLFVRLVTAAGDPEKLHQPVLLRDFKTKVADVAFRDRLMKFIRDDVAKVMAKARELLAGEHTPGLPPALATRTVNDAPDIFLALLHWLHRGGEIEIGSREHRAVIAIVTALSWFSPGGSRQKLEYFREWMKAVSGQPLENFWDVANLRVLFTRMENPVPSFPAPNVLRNFLVEEIVMNPEYNWGTLGGTCSAHPIFAGYSHIQVANSDASSTAETMRPPVSREKLLQDNLRNFVGILSGNTNLLLFAQRDFIRHKFHEFQQWDVVLNDTNCPWDWDHIFPSAYCRKGVPRKYRDWHNSIGNKRAEELSSNRSNRAAVPKDKLADPNTRRDSFISDSTWALIECTDPLIRDVVRANDLCRIILTRLAEIYAEWYVTFEIENFHQS